MVTGEHQSEKVVNYQSDNNDFTSQAKLEWEIKKLQVEVQHLKKPWVMQPTSWIAIFTIILSVGTATSQYLTSQREAILAKIEGEQAKLDKNKADRAREGILSEINRLNTNLNNLKAQQKDLSIHVASLETQRQGIKHSLIQARNNLAILQQTKASPELEKAQGLLAGQIQRLSLANEKLGSSINELQQINQVSVSQTSATKQEISNITSFLTGKAATSAINSTTQNGHAINLKLVQETTHLFNKDKSIRVNAVNNLVRHWKSEESIVPVLLNVTNSRMNNLDGIANVLRVFQFVDRRHMLTHRTDVEDLLGRIEDLPNVTKTIKDKVELIRDRYRRADRRAGKKRVESRQRQ